MKFSTETLKVNSYYEPYREDKFYNKLILTMK